MDWTIKDYEDLRNLGLVLAAVVAVPLAGWRSLVAHKQAKIATDNHLAETYTKAIDQIGNEKEAIQLGGLYALEKIARNNRQYHGQIIEVLCAFVRLHAPLFDEDKEYNLHSPKLIVQTALTIIGRRNTSFDSGIYGDFWFQKIIPRSQEYPVKIDLKYTNLKEMNLKEAKFDDANLSNVNLEKANLQFIDLQRAYLEDVNFSSANLQWSWLNEADLSGANLEGANLHWADLSEAILEKANLQDAILTNASLRDTKLNFEQITSAKFDENTKFPEDFSKERLSDLIEKQKKEAEKNRQPHDLS